MVAIGQYPTAFERRARLPLHSKFSGDNDFSGTHGGVYIATLQITFDVEIVAPMLMHWVPAAAHIARRIDHRLQDLELDRHDVGEIFRFAARRRDARSNGFANITDLVGSKRRP